jgi:Domain of unknown function (DUF4214)/Methyltransferase domain
VNPRRLFTRHRGHRDRRDDERFLDETYQELLGRPGDASGRVHYLDALGKGMSREQIVADLRESEEYRLREAARTRTMPDLRAAESSRFGVLTADNGTDVPVLIADDDTLDWIEKRISDDRYYEQPGIWGFSIDLDKRVMAELVSLLEPRSAVEVGCSSGAVLHCLHEAGVEVCGIDISELAKNAAPDSVRDSIRLGDIRTMHFDRTFDVFEHIHRAGLDAFIGALVDLVADGGFVFVNVPAFGRDDVFGEVFTMFLPEWREDAARGQSFRHLQIDDFGYPSHGHLVWATTEWWVDTFERAGITRAPAIEQALHDQYDWYFDFCAPARRAFYVFAKHGDEQSIARLCDRIRARESRVLVEFSIQIERDAASRGSTC